MNFFSNFYLYVDDERQPLMNYDYWAKTYEEAISVIATYCTPHYTKVILDIDNDLGTEKSGYDIAKWCVENGWTGEFRVHSMNIVGRKNIRQLLTHYGWKEFI